jgi:hypothetical protein
MENEARENLPIYNGLPRSNSSSWLKLSVPLYAFAIAFHNLVWITGFCGVLMRRNKLCLAKQNIGTHST